MDIFGNEELINYANSKKLVVIYYSKTSCGPCIHIKPKIRQFVDAHSKDIAFIAIPGDLMEEHAKINAERLNMKELPFKDYISKERIINKYKLNFIPYMLFLDHSGEIVFDRGVVAIRDRLPMDFLKKYDIIDNRP